MEIIEYFSADNKNWWIEKIKESDWIAGQFLYELIRDNKLKELCGESTRVLLLTDGAELVSFCTLAETDDIPSTDLTPWIGFVYTFPKYRGRRYMGRLISDAEEIAFNEKAKYTYISTGHIGLYEKFGYEFYKTQKNMNGEVSRIYRKSLNKEL